MPPNTSIYEFYKNSPTWFFKSKFDNHEKISKYMLEKFNKEFKVDIKEYDAIKTVSSSNYPILLSAGSNEHLEELFETLKKVNPKETDIIILPGCNHGNGMYKQTKLYQDKIKEFINKHL